MTAVELQSRRIGFGAQIAGDLESARQDLLPCLEVQSLPIWLCGELRGSRRNPFELTGLIAGAQALTAITKDGNES